MSSEEPYTIRWTRTARRNMSEELPVEIADAVLSTITDRIAVNPHRKGKPLEEPFEHLHSCRRGTFRILSRIDEAKHAVEIHSIKHRRDAYHT